MTDQTHNVSNPCIFIFDSARLRSHLFFRYLTTSPSTFPIQHPFVPAAQFGPECMIQHLRHSEARQKELDEQKATIFGNDTYQSCREAFESAVKEAHQNAKVPVANEHWLLLLRIELVLGLLRGEIQEPAQLGRNPTHLPDEIFHSLRPIILIRHPALAISSIYRDALNLTKFREGDEDLDVICVNRPLRILFDYFKAQKRRPIVVDAEDVLWRTEEVAKNLCAALGTIDPTTLSDRWEPKSKEEIERMNPYVYKVTQKIVESSGIERPREKVSGRLRTHQQNVLPITDVLK